MQQKQQSPPAIFSVCAPSDIQSLERWEAHLRPLEQAGTVSIWSVRHLQPGTDRLKHLYHHLDQADLVVLLLSADFFTDGECEALMEHALERHQQGTVRVIPLLLRPFAFHETKLATFTPFPSDERPVELWENTEAALDDCVRGLRRILGRPVTKPLGGKPKRPSVEEQNRARMLQRLRHAYEQMLAQSLQGITQIELGIASKPDVVQNAATLLFRTSTRSERLLPSGTSILDVYDEAAHELLILGTPGAGKSTLLVELAQQLVVRADANDTHPLPVILPLSSWAVRCPPLHIWLAEQVAQIYDIPKHIAEQWIKEDRLLPLLDGLDEMNEAARLACTTAINVYHSEHLLCPLVVCSRSAEYTAASIQKQGRLHLACAIEVQPLSEAQLDAVLVQAGKPFAALQSELKKNPELRTLAMTPLWLDVLLLTFKDTSIPKLSRQRATLQRQVCERYVQRMVKVKGQIERYPLEQTTRWLSWLARQMYERNLSTFVVDRFEPDWLAGGPRAFYRWSGWLVWGLVIGLASLLVYWLVSGLTNGPIFVLLFGGVSVLFGGLFGLFTGLLSEAPFFEKGFKKTCATVFREYWRAVLFWLPNGLLWGLAFVLIDELFGGVVFALVVWLIVRLVGWLVFALVWGPVFFRIGSEQFLDRYFYSSPGQSLRRLVRNGLTIWLVSGLAVWLILMLISGLEAQRFIWSWKEAELELVVGLLVGWASQWVYGIAITILPLFLRLWLRLANNFPFRAVTFLEDACTRHLLVRIGGGYRFVHRLLLNHFATLDYRQVLDIQEKQLGADHPDTVRSLYALAQLYQEQESYVEAEELYQRVLSICEQRLSANHLETADCLGHLMMLYQEQGRYVEAESSCRRVLSICEQQLGTNHPDTTKCLCFLALFCQQQGKYEEAERLYMQASSIFEQQSKDFLDTAESLKQQGKDAEAKRLYMQASSILEQLSGTSPLLNIATSLKGLALLYLVQERFVEAERLFEGVLKVHELQLGPQHPEMAQSLHDLARLYQVQGKYAVAEQLRERALTIREQQLGTDHPDTAQSLHKLAQLYQIQGKYAEAEPLYERALTIRKQQLGPEDPQTASSFDGLANLYQVQGKYEQAEPLMVHALAICEQKLGLEDPQTATSLNSLANLYLAQGKYEQAGPLYERALRIQEQKWGAEHSITAAYLNGLANLHQAQGKYDQAESLYERALRIQEQKLGPEHPATATSLTDLSDLYRVQGKYDQAESLYERALCIQEQKLGPEHPATATSLNGLADLYRVQGKYEQAELLAARALVIRDQKLGPEHPATATSLNSLADLYQAQGKYEQAEPLAALALVIRGKKFGPEHPATAASLNSLADLYLAQRKYEQAKLFYQPALHIREQKLGPEHPATATSLNGLANLYLAQRKYEQAKPLYRRALRIRKQKLGPEHPDTQAVRSNYLALIQVMRRKGKGGTDL